MDQLSHDISFTNPTQQLYYSACAKMFVDDNTNDSNRFLPWLHKSPHPNAVQDMIQHDAQTWERFLWTSDGLLKLEKCLYYHMMWTFHAESTASLTPASQLPPTDLSLGDSGISTPISQYMYSCAHHTLGWLLI
jgi:hypothetical protein